MDRPRENDRPRRWARRLGALALVLGGLGFVELGLTYFWEEPFSSFAARGRQAEVRREVDRLLAAPVLPAVARRIAVLPDGRRLAYLAARARRAARDGHGLGRIAIADIDVDRAFVEGTGTSELKRGPGHYPRTDLPGEDGTVGIAGHRTTYGAPFRHLDALGKGDEIVVTMPYGRFVYRVDRVFEVTPDRTEVTRDLGRPRLVLTACTPLFSAARRIVVDARLVSSRPAAAVARIAPAGRALSRR